MSHREQIAKIIHEIQEWPVSEREALAREILLLQIDSAANQADAAPQKVSFSIGLGIAQGDGPPPSDDQIKIWMDEHRMKKYG